MKSAHQTLLEAAKTMDALNDRELIMEFVNLRAELRMASAQLHHSGRGQGGAYMLSLLNEHGSPENMLAAMREQLDVLKRQLEAVEQAKVKISEYRQLIRRELTPLSDPLHKEAMHLHQSQLYLTKKVAGALNERDANIKKMIEMGVPEDVARANAKPTDDDVEALVEESRVNAMRMEEISAIVRTSTATLLHAYPELAAESQPDATQDNATTETSTFTA